MSTLSEYYSMNQSENPYTMESFKDISRVHLIQTIIKTEAKEGARILDVGCGDMYLATQMPQFTWVGVDINTHVNAGQCVKHDLERFPYPFEPHSFDLIVCSEVLEHLYDPVKVTKEIRRLLKHTGTYVLSTPNFDFIEYFMQHFRPILFDPAKSWTKEHIHQYNIESHQQILQAAGFKVASYIGADPTAGAFFADARTPLAAYLQANLSLDKIESEKRADSLLGVMFKDWMHTIIITAKAV